MTDPKGDREFDLEPDTNTDDNPEEASDAPAPAFPVADPVPEPPAPAEDPAPPPAPAAGPRTFPEHYWLLLGGSLILASTLSVWERAGIYGAEIWGGQSLLRGVLMGFAVYVVAVGIANIASGRLRGMGITFLAGAMALWLGIKGFLAYYDVPGFMDPDELWNHLRDTTGVNWKIHKERFLSQWAPGVWLSTIGGAIVILVFIKAIFFAKKKDPVPAPAPRRRGRR